MKKIYAILLIWTFTEAVSSVSESLSQPVFKGSLLNFVPEIPKEYFIAAQISPQNQKENQKVQRQQRYQVLNQQVQNQPKPEVKKQQQVLSIPIKNLQNLNELRMQQKRIQDQRQNNKQKPKQANQKIVKKEQIIFEQSYELLLKADKTYTVPQIQDRSVLGIEVKLTQQQQAQLKALSQQRQAEIQKQQQINNKKRQQQAQAQMKKRQQQRIRLQEQKKNRQIYALKQKQLQILKQKQIELQKQKELFEKQKQRLQQLRQQREKQQLKRRQQYLERRKEEQERLKERQKQIQMQRQRQIQRQRQNQLKDPTRQNLIQQKKQVIEINQGEKNQAKNVQRERFNIDNAQQKQDKQKPKVIRQRSTKQQGRKSTDRPERPERQQNIRKELVLQQSQKSIINQPQIRFKPKPATIKQNIGQNSHISKIFFAMVLVSLGIFMYGYNSKEVESKRRPYNPTADDEQITLR